MQRLTLLLLAISLNLVTATLHAADVIRVNSMNYPAWLVREHQTTALSPGEELRPSDLVRTGEGGRLLLEMADGSAVKLGESARFLIEDAEMREDADGGILDSTFQVLRGAFRFTSSFFRNAPARHRVDVNIGVITAGVRGTDIWGRSNPEHDLVCLIEGAIAVDSPGVEQVEMSDPLSFYVKPKNQTPLPVGPVDTEKLKDWAQQTELDAGRGIATSDGQWKLVLMSLSNNSGAEEVMREFRTQGFAVEGISVDHQGRSLQRIVLPGFVSRDAARNARLTVEAQLGISDAWPWNPELVKAHCLFAAEWQ